MAIRPIALLTDFSLKDPYVGLMKGVIFSINPEAQVIDLCHNVAPQDVNHGALLLQASYHFFPSGTIFTVVVDPGVGTNRKVLCVETEKYFFLAPDNGILDPILQKEDVIKIVDVTDDRYFLPKISSTFHGRDIFAPVAAYISKGLPPQMLGSEIKSIQTLNLPVASFSNEELNGEIVIIDHFGNLITNVFPEMLKDNNLADFEKIRVIVDNSPLQGIYNTYGDKGIGEPLCLVGSSGMIEIAINNGSAAEHFKASKGTKVRFKY